MAKTAPAPKDVIAGRGGEGSAGVPGAAVLLCPLGEEAGVEFPHLHHIFLGKRGVEGNWGGGSRSEGVNVMEARWIRSRMGLSFPTAEARPEL